MGEAAVVTEDRAHGRNTRVDEYGRLEDEGKMEEVRMWRQKRKVLVFGGSPHEPGPPITSQTLPPLNP